VAEILKMNDGYAETGLVICVAAKSGDDVGAKRRWLKESPREEENDANGESSKDLEEAVARFSSLGIGGMGHS
jgi:hypothetical protein